MYLQIVMIRIRQLKAYQSIKNFWEERNMYKVMGGYWCIRGTEKKSHCDWSQSFKDEHQEDRAGDISRTM